MKSVLICRCVCKHWNSLISDPNFAKMLFTHTATSTLIRDSESTTFHLLEYDLIEWHDRRRSNKPFCCRVYNALKPNLSSSRKITKLDPKFKVPLETGYIKPSNSCNGLLYVRSTNIGTSLVCNPITGEFIRLPKAPPIMKPCQKICYGFGFHQKTSQYKIVRIQTIKHSDDLHDDGGMIVEMHIVGTSTWINIEVIDYPKNSTFLSYNSSYFNGALHWIGIDADDYASIWCFNFDTERFQSFPMPVIDADTRYSLFEFRGSLCVMFCNKNVATMWMMEKYGIGESWVCIFNISVRPVSDYDHLFFHPPHTNSKIITSRSHGSIFYLDRGNKEFKFFYAFWFAYTFEAIRHVPSLISLKDVIIGDNVEVLSVYSFDKRDRGF
ncbi:hypothetical protein PIB30_044941 [Stylosanthes scabra]|uniref:Uncharacterized protein n=1 Tax=Stylosanthes scabra TaxID=79078 RepID=A0ABU6QHH9_9FABA|nr:hypothetical protein [Stylosanthes scabra]